MREISVGKNLVADTLTTIFTVPTGYYAKWNLMYLFNASGSTKTIMAQWNDASEGTTIYVYNGTIANNDFVRMDGGAYVVLEEGDTIKMQSEATSTFSTICTFELIRKGN